MININFLSIRAHYEWEYSGLFRLINGVPTGSLWFDREEPRDRAGLEVG